MKPNDRSYSTINDSPEAITFSWEFTTTFIFDKITDCGDATSLYDMLFPEGVTVRDFVDWVFANGRRERGTLYIENLGIELEYDNIEAHGRGGQFNGSVLDKKIDHIKANGGWGMMNYFIYVEE